MHSFRPFILSCIFLVWIFHQNHATLWSHSRRSVFNTPVFSEHLWTPKKLNNVSPHWDFFCFLLSFGKENCKAKGVFSILYLAATMHIRNLDLRNWADQMWHSLATTVCIYRQHFSQWGTDLKHKLTIYLSNSFCFRLNLSSDINLSIMSCIQNVWLPLQCTMQQEQWELCHLGFRNFVSHFLHIQIFQTEISTLSIIFLHPNIPDKWKRVQLSLDQMKKKERVKVKS